MATHSSILAWEIPWIEETGRLLSTRSQRVRHDFATEHSPRNKQAVHTPSARLRTGVFMRQLYLHLLWLYNYISLSLFIL